jgi:broad specificity phosphatase PhoE
MIVSLIRHGSTSWNEQGRMQGRRDIPLSEAGRAQVRTWRIPADIATDTAEWVASPLRRTAETAELLCGSRFRPERALIEMDWGEWEGFGVEELRNRLGDAYTRNEALGLDFRPPGGESPREVLDRVRSWLKSATRRGVPVIVVTHLGVLRALLAAATGWDMTGKPPVRLQGECLHRFAVDDEGTISIVGCNVALVANRPMAP